MSNSLYVYVLLSFLSLYVCPFIQVCQHVCLYVIFMSVYKFYCLYVFPHSICLKMDSKTLFIFYDFVSQNANFREFYCRSFSSIGSAAKDTHSYSHAHIYTYTVHTHTQIITRVNTYLVITNDFSNDGFSIHRDRDKIQRNNDKI